VTAVDRSNAASVFERTLRDDQASESEKLEAAIAAFVDDAW